ncbi:Uma2 family endonuclease [Pleurocapsa sp. CCALA 161]|uniref:Uma2 family endonuclease n=1 Tax=Pleurocapsa sp. CCALA 161 TaxID=2107688 RepID=UPI000D066BC2|nr:Uma2 family endonuclease [Pleurocapsa sp. CCALA 161]PSB10728.1 Uma2 family endonuclease [Pleurocapsa sp. CCALA 161]
MLIWPNLPINRDKFAQNDQLLTITAANWLDYQHFDSAEYPGYRVSYFKGEITIVSPGRNHERIAAYCEKYGLPDFPFGQTRLNAWGQAGREPDLAYAFDRDKDLPDLVVEVIISSGDLETLKSSYKNIGIGELWIWKDNAMTFYALADDNYAVVATSEILTRIKSELLVQYVNRGLTESPLVIKQDFLKVI